MTIYSVHTPSEAAGSANGADRIHFERQGFAWGAFLFGPLWLIGRRFWRAFILWCQLAALVIAAINLGYISGGLAFVLAVMSAIYLGLEGPALAAAAYDRGRWRLADVAIGADRTTAERGFFLRWSPVAPPAPPAPARRPMDGPPPADVIGLFPEAGG
jgi:hypothetical protein